MRQPREQPTLAEPEFGHAPQCTPKNSSDTPTMLSKKAPLAELRLFPFVSININSSGGMPRVAAWLD